MSIPTQPIAIPPNLCGRLALRLGAAGLVCTGAAIGIAAGYGSEAVVAALMAGGASLLAVGIGLVATSLALGFRTVEPAFAVLAGSVARLLLGLALAYAIQAAAAPVIRPYWFAFLLVMLGVLFAEVAAAARLLNPPPETGSA